MLLGTSKTTKLEIRCFSKHPKGIVGGGGIWVVFGHCGKSKIGDLGKIEKVFIWSGNLVESRVCITV